MTADHRLAVYGSLRPGEANHHQLAELAGDWRLGVVHGWVGPAWGAAAGYPGLRLDPAGPEVAVQVFTSEDLPRHWARLDTFEGAEYERVVTWVKLAEGHSILANLYVLRPEPSAPDV